MADFNVSLGGWDFLEEFKAVLIEHAAPNVVKAAQLVNVGVTELESCAIIK